MGRCSPSQPQSLSKSQAISSLDPKEFLEEKSLLTYLNPKELNRAAMSNKEGDVNGKAVFLTKKQREELALQRLQQKRQEEETKKQEAAEAHRRFITGQTIEDKKKEERLKKEKEEQERQRRQREENIGAAEQQCELNAIKQHYLGAAEKKSNFVKPSEKNGRTFQFEWKESDDTGKDDLNPLYSKRQKVAPLFGRGYFAGVDQREQRKESNFLVALSEKRMQEAKRLEDDDTNITDEERRARDQARSHVVEQFRRSQLEDSQRRSVKNNDDKIGRHWSEKALSEMTERDWRIFREDFDIRVQGGGRNTLPLRFWSETVLPAPLARAIQAAGYEKPSPIQRQAIPIGLARRDIIGIAETGSGKTCAFLVPLLAYILQLPQYFIDRVADQGPLAIVMAPTRELAEQIEKECRKLATFTSLRVLSVVGGRDIEEQGFEIRKGVEIVIGTPGRMLDCISRHYLVLNQCNYVVLDEADRMIDMGFDEQVEEVLNQMGGLLRPENEDPNLMIEDMTNQDSSTMYRTTAMFTATMSPEIEIIAKQYLRHPVLVRIGDVDSGKNRRIEQRVHFLASEAAKKNLLMEEVNRSLRSMSLHASSSSASANSSSSSTSSADVKIIVFVNTQKAADTICRQLEDQRYHVGALHGGKSQEIREETLEAFRSSRINILVATDVAGRGLDIPDVSHVINYDCPKKIANYCHRIGRTGRAGKFGTAVTFLTDADIEVMYDLKQYLESTDAAVPHQLAHHPAAQAAPGARDEKGRLLGQKRDRTMFAKD